MRMKRITVRLDEGDLKRARARAKREGTTLSKVVARRLREYLRDKSR